jgi:peptidoglycan/LPS O-acetylase OafA/YrhL
MVDVRSDGDDPGRAIAHVPALDGVRGIAITAVLALHFGGAADFPNRFPSASSIWLDRVLYAGWAGVDLFFVLSGFLITSILLESKNGAHYFRRFYGRRVLRILPLYYIALILGLLVLPRIAPEHAWGLLREGESGDIWLWTYTLNIGLAFGLIAMPIASLSHFWTLAIEEQFYLVWPWVVKVTSERVLLRVCAGAMVGALLMRIGWVASGLASEGAYRFTLTRADSLAGGAAIAVLMRHPLWRLTLSRMAGVMCAISVGAIAIMLVRIPRFYPSDSVVVTFSHSILAVASASLIVLAVRQNSRGWLANPALRMLGKFSYGMYVWHFPLQRALLTWYGFEAPASGANPRDTMLFLVAGIGGSLLLGWISYYVIERPFLRRKRLFRYDEFEPTDARTVSAEPGLASSGRTR